MSIEQLALLQKETQLDLAEVAKLLQQLSAEQKLWLSGYLAASAQQLGPAPVATAASNQSSSKLTIAYGSQTGNAEGVASELYQQAQQQGIQSELLSLADLTAKQLKDKSHLALVISTHGEGEAPDDAEIFYEQLMGKRAPELKDLSFSVLALGDSSYELFCHTGKEIDERLEALGAMRLIDRIDCDVDYEADAAEWQSQVKTVVEPLLESAPSNNITPFPAQVSHAAATHDKSNPYQAEVLAVQKITAHDSIKHTYHIELAIDESSVQYEAGDSLGIVAHNDPAAVSALLEALSQEPEASIDWKGENLTLREAFEQHIEITQISKPWLQYVAERLADDELKAISADHQAFNAFVQYKQLLDVVKQYPAIAEWPLDWLDELRALTPRLYSIASSPTQFEDEVHLTVNLEQQANDAGLASGLLCQRIEEGDVVSVYVEPNKHFKLPSDDTDVIMIGPGTGIAPFRAFVQERQARKASGKNWLFFGNPNFHADFLYQTEWQRLQKQGFLHRIDVAFSRDQEEKIYVQHRLAAQAADIWQWLENGAAIYICGDANRMAKDVEQTLLNIIAEHGGKSEEEAKNHLKELKRNQRYQKDVY